MKLHPSPMLRAFTMLETLMAAALGTLVVLGCIAVFGAIDRTEAATARRYDEATRMARLHLVMDRVFGDLVIQSADAPAPTNATTRPTAGRSVATSATDFKAPDAAHNGEATAEPRPRVSLDQDLGPQVKSAMQNAGMESRGAPRQRFEVVTSHAPVPPSFGVTDPVQLQADMEAEAPLAARSVFELRPDASTPRERLDPGETLEGNGKGWTLWYRKLPPNTGLATPDPYTLDPTQDPAAVRLAHGLAECSWQVFKTVTDTATNKPKGRERVPQLTATSLQDLPAYAEMRVTTVSGLSANWMFEVGWTYGPETTEEAQAASDLAAGPQGQNGQNGGSTQANGNRAGVQGRPGFPGGPQGPITITGKDGRTTTIMPQGKPGTRPGGPLNEPPSFAPINRSGRGGNRGPGG